MSEKPILFNGEMVKAILGGRKTQTRRPVKRHPEYDEMVVGNNVVGFGMDGFHESLMQVEDSPKVQYSPFGKVGDTLWVRETHWQFGEYPTIKLPDFVSAKRQKEANAWRSMKTSMRDAIQYCADSELDESIHSEKNGYDGWYWRKMPSIHMPRWASRIHLLVKRVWVEKLDQISEEGARAEGITVLPLQDPNDPSAWWQSAPGVHQSRSPRIAFRKLWDSIYAKSGYGFSTIPYVWCCEFERIEK